MPRTRVSGLAASAVLVGALTSPSPHAVSAAGNEGRPSRDFSANLKSFSEVPAISSDGRGSFRARLNQDGDTLRYRLSFSGLSAPVTQAHIHFGRIHTSGGIMVWLCQSATSVDPTGLSPACVNEGSVDGTLTAANIVQPGNQGIVAGEFDEFVRALRNDAGYVNVHTTAFPGGEIRGEVQE